jgi:plastocyanin
MRRVGWVLVVAALTAMAVAAPTKIVSEHVGGSSSGQGSGDKAVATVRMAGLKFAPELLVVRKGTTVTFANNDVAPHTVSEDVAGGVDSGTLAPGKAFRLRVDHRLVYHCAIHPFMRATINLAG